MQELLSAGGLGLVILGEILRDIQGAKDRLSHQDLRSPEGVNEALELQGEIKGLNRVIDRMFEIAEGAD